MWCWWDVDIDFAELYSYLYYYVLKFYEFYFYYIQDKPHGVHLIQMFIREHYTYFNTCIVCLSIIKLVPPLLLLYPDVNS